MNEKPPGGEMQFGILGALQATGDDGRQFAFERRHTRLLAVLLLSPNKVVGRNQLIDAVWDDAPPATATRQLQNCISTLRQQLPSPDGARPVIAAQATGYLIQLKPEQLDAQLFQAGMAAARACETAGDIAGATTRLRESLALWRGPALSGLSGRAIEAGSARLNEQRLAAVEDCLELELQQGRFAQAVSELVELVAGHPLRESMVGLLMRALHGSGRRSDALHVFAQLRDRLVGELGLDPGAALQDLHARLLRDELPSADASSTGWRRPAALAELAAAGRASPSRAANPRQLPASMRHFAGRDAELAALDRTVAEAARGEAMISVIHGMGGIGKTALAVRWAHRVADQFPDGQLFVNLRGFDPGREPLAPAEAIREFLDAFAIPAEQTPASLDARVNLFRTLLAGRSVLIVLDNARDAEQVRPLLPGSTTCMVVVTSRNELIGLVAREGAQPLTLDLLTAAEAYQLLARRLGTERLTAEPEAVSELVQRCARLPLALAIIAARAAAHPTFPLATFAAELADAQRRLDAVDGGDQSTQVRSVFSWSYERLSQPAAQLFRLLGLQPGPDITVPAAASLIGVAAAQARQLLTDLARAHLVTEHSLGRYTCHDLLSAYAREQALAKDSTRERDAAVSRLLDYYLQAAARADILVMPHRRRTPVPASGDRSLLPVFPDQRSALSWLEMNRGNLVAAVRLAVEYHAHDRCWRLANVQWGLFSLEKHWDDWIATHELGLASARVITDQQAQFTMLSSLGTAYRECGQLAKAYRHNAEALAVSRTLGDQRDEAQALNGLGTVCAHLGQLDEARERYDAALRIRREIGDRWGEAITTCNLGELDLHVGRLAAAEHNGVAALEIRREIGDRLGEAVALNLLGQVCQTADERDKAVHYFRDALAIHREVSDYAMEAETLYHLGIAYDTLAEPGPRDECLQAALEIYTRLGMPAAEQVSALLRR